MFKAKHLYLVIMSGLTSTAMYACYWQTKKYFIACERWKIIARQLSSTPTPLHQLQELYAYRYVTIKGEQLPGEVRVQRRRNGHMGYLSLRAIRYSDVSESEQSRTHDIIIMEGWCPDDYDQLMKLNEKAGKWTSQTNKLQQFQGILRDRQKKDYLHENYSKEDIQFFKMNTYINLQEIIDQLGLTKDDINTRYYLQVLKPLNAIDQFTSYPYQYRVDNFELPYLTPDKHRAYAMFWFGCSVVGIMSMRRSLKIS